MRKIYTWLASVVAVIGAIITFGAIQRRKGKQEVQNEQNEKFIETSERINQVDDFADSDNARDFLHNRKKR